MTQLLQTRILSSQHGTSMFVDGTNDDLRMTGMEPEHLRKYFCVKIFLIKNCRTGEGNIVRIRDSQALLFFFLWVTCRQVYMVQTEQKG